MFYDTATLEIIVRSVALSAFVETPRDVAVITEQASGRSRLAAAGKAARDGLNGGLRILRRRLAGLAEAVRPSDRCAA